MGDASKLKSILEMIEHYRKQYGDAILEYEVYLEQCSEADKAYKRGPQEWNARYIKDNSVYDDEDEYFESLGGVGIDNENKIIFISVNY